MEQHDLRQWESRCTQEEPALCRAGCPLNMDGRAFATAMASGQYQEARNILDKCLPLPGITASLCEAPCMEYCLRGRLGGAIALGRLERACLNLSSSRLRNLRLPPRPGQVAILGAGPSGLVVAYDLSRKGFKITIYHHNPPGGWLQDLDEMLLPRQRLEQELSALRKNGVTFQSVPALDQPFLDRLQPQVQAIYLALDDAPAQELVDRIKVIDPITGVTSIPGLFAGGQVTAARPSYIQAAAQGRNAATSLERALQKASLTASRVADRQGRTALHTETKGIKPLAQVQPANGLDYTETEAKSEAGRCLDCQCLSCVRRCVYLQRFKGYPKVYARQIYNNEAIVKGVHQANILINSCSLCRQCETVCPNDFSMADLCLQARQRMVVDDRMPPSAHAFALEEMRSALDERSVLLRHAPKSERSSRVFFPGCQLSGVRPEQAYTLYQQLRAQETDTGLWLSCCGAPAHWSGRQEETAAVAARLRRQWEELGCPEVLCACSSCLQFFHQHLDDVAASSVWTRFELPTTACPTGEPVAVIDPCTARHDLECRQAVRTLLAGVGQAIMELERSGEVTECCGYGGLLANANPTLADAVGQARIKQSSAPLLTYCIMCREQLARTGKPSLHLLDLLWPDKAVPADAPVVTLSRRRANRQDLRNRIEQDLYGNAPLAPQPWEELVLIVEPQVEHLLNERRILHQDIQQVLALTEADGVWFSRDQEQKRLTQARLGAVTIWVNYTPTSAGYQIHSAWSHRMQVTRIR